MSVSETLKARWTENLESHGLAVALKKHFSAVLDAQERVGATVAALAKNNDLSETGKAKERASVATLEARHVAKARRAVDMAKVNIRDQRRALLPAVKDRADLASTMLRQEIRSGLRTMKPGEILAVAADPNTETVVLEAMLEAPNYLVGIDQNTRDNLLKIITDRAGDAVLGGINEQEEAIELLAAACDTASATLVDAAGINAYGFEKWIGEVAPIDVTEREAETVKFKAEIVQTDAAGLPLAERMSLVDQLLKTNTAELSAA
ncbi:MAG TPA: hypothetical protein VH206_14295 [Xanthobacteraceae bacterium]|jgi:hypothetical protein|nr:hypothetical protein [Xanthobacteraceae bacterium]